ncbi:MAG TPA: prephenate dehydrogenase [Clostridia bacterium]|nr:prephenate dehydrogenase [Clostridia bacterium]
MSSRTYNLQMQIEQITIVGTGLIGGSFALAIKAAGFGGRIVGCDRPDVLERALKLGAINAGEVDPVRACEGSQLVMLATPIGSIIDHIERLGPVLSPDVLITDTGSTKVEIVARAQQVFGDAGSRRFLPGHPISGKETGGIEQAQADLFANATWVIAPAGGASAAVRPEFTRSLHGEYMRLLESIGAQVVMISPERHDRICAYVSHLPQMLSTALAACVADEVGGDVARDALSGPALRDMTRIARSPYGMWRDIAFTNTQNLHDALLKVEQRLAHLRENLRTRGLQGEFERAHELFLPPKAKDEFEPPKF